MLNRKSAAKKKRSTAHKKAIQSKKHSTVTKEMPMLHMSNNMIDEILGKHEADLVIHQYTFRQIHYHISNVPIFASSDNEIPDIGLTMDSPEKIKQSHEKLMPSVIELHNLITKNPSSPEHVIHAALTFLEPLLLEGASRSFLFNQTDNKDFNKESRLAEKANTLKNTLQHELRSLEILKDQNRLSDKQTERYKEIVKTYNEILNNLILDERTKENIKKLNETSARAMTPPLDKPLIDSIAVDRTQAGCFFQPAQADQDSHAGSMSFQSLKKK